MSNFGCGCNRNLCVTLAIFASIIIGFVTAILTITATIAVTPAFLWVTGGIAVVFLALLLGVSPALSKAGRRNCICNVLYTFLTGVLGTILTSVVLLAVTFAATSVVGAIITGALLLFFSLLIISTTCLIKCIIDCDD
ncbi:MAG: hypothetical protein J6A69_03995 [Clostridia bacterium]|nr:hypothetical protein [Clostridia bacterium]